VAVRVTRSRRVRVLTGLDGSEAGVSNWEEGRLVWIRYVISCLQVKYRCHWRRWCAHWAHCLHRGTFCQLIAG
jgi:hypothetical protein